MRRCFRSLGVAPTVVVTTLLLFPTVSLAQPPASNVISPKLPWSYSAAASGTRPVARNITLAAERPDDMTSEPENRGLSRSYGQLRYGSENSRRVLLVVDHRADGGFDLFVDLDRDRRVEANERIEGSGHERQLPLACEILQQDQVEQFPRQVQIRLGALGDRLSVATLGSFVGEVELADDSGSRIRRSAQRIDGDANGLLADSRDRLQIDLNGDGKFDPISEQFPWLPVQTLAGRRYAVRADRQGEQLQLHEITGTGMLQVAVDNLPPASRVIAFEATVYSDDGSAWSLSQPGRFEQVPVGRYTLGSVTLRIDTGEREPWHFVFSRSGAIQADDWIDVAADQKVSLQAVGNMSFFISDTEDQARPGGQLTVSPRLYTEDGLLVNLSCRGREIGSFDHPQTHNMCTIRLTTDNGQTLSSARSGFA